MLCKTATSSILETNHNMTTWREIERNDSVGMRLALLADPIIDSMYPVLVRAGMESVGVQHDYHSIRVLETEFELCVRHLKEIGFYGAHISMPHKAAAARIAERFFEVKFSMGVANALDFQGGIFGTNTEVPSFRKIIGDIEPGTCLLMGSGPAARTAAIGLLANGWRVKVWNRNAMKSRLLASLLSREGDLELIPVANPSGCKLIVNATRLGMKTGEQLPVQFQNTMRDSVVLDFVFRRVPTEFLRGARLRGLRAIDGRELLVEKVAMTLDWWTGKSVDRIAMLKSVGLNVFN